MKGRHYAGTIASFISENGAVWTLERLVSISPKNPNAHLIVAELASQGINTNHCAVCGWSGGDSGLVNHYILHNQNGLRVAVGIECLGILVGEDNVDELRKVASRAGAQWANRVAANAWRDSLQASLAEKDASGEANETYHVVVEYNGKRPIDYWITPRQMLLQLIRTAERGNAKPDPADATHMALWRAAGYTGEIPNPPTATAPAELTSDRDAAICRAVESFLTRKQKG